VPHASLSQDIKTDVLVMGAGITGASIADALAAAGVKVAVGDKRGLARGSTAASTALVLYEIDTPLIALARKIGKQKAIRAWRRSRLAVEALAARLGELGLTDVVPRVALPCGQRPWTKRASTRARGAAGQRIAELFLN
jgi:glycine/D-amino acid oxidase-like deaminating enzyme